MDNDTLKQTNQSGGAGQGNSRSRIITIPNVLSLFRILLIPAIAWLYTEEKQVWSMLLLFLSGVTDVADGYIARHFNMTSDIGKVLDPIADKLTQVVLLICFALRFPWVVVPVVLMIVKEAFMGITGFMVIKRSGVVLGADWHGKAATVVLFVTMLIHIGWYDIPVPVSVALTVAASFMIILSFILYAVRNFKVLKVRREKD